MSEKHSVVRQLKRRYLTSSKEQRGEILDQVCELTGYSRSYAALLLRHYARGSVYAANGVLLKPSVKRTRNRARCYDAAVYKPLKKIWAVFDCPCGKRLAPALPEMLRVLEREGELQVSGGLRSQLRVLAQEPDDDIAGLSEDLLA